LTINYFLVIQDEPYANEDGNGEGFESWDNYNPSMLKKQKSKKLSPETRVQSKQTSWSKLADIKIKWTEIEQQQKFEAAKAEHELIMQKLKNDIAASKAEHILRMEQMNEKHELEMEILRSKLQNKD